MARRLALLIGMSEYGEDLGRLVAPPEDVTLMARVLGSPELGGFEILGQLVNADQGAVGNAIASFFRQAQRDDLLLLYFSGHGITDDDGKLYLATPATDKINYVVNAISASSIHTLSGNCRARRQVIVLDCCFSGAFAEGWRAKGGQEVDLRQILGAEGRVVLASSTSTQKSFEVEGSETSDPQQPIVSLYTQYLAEGIETGAADNDNDGCIYVRELHDYAKAKVQEAKPKMTPEILVDREGYEIKIANARRSPDLLFRKRVEEYLDHERGELSIMAIEILANFRQRLALTEDSAQAIIDSLLGPIRQRNHNVDRYRQQLADLLARAYPLTERVERELHDWQEQVLGLADGDVAAVRSTLLAVAERDRLARETGDNVGRDKHTTPIYITYHNTPQAPDLSAQQIQQIQQIQDLLAQLNLTVETTQIALATQIASQPPTWQQNLWAALKNAQPELAKNSVAIALQNAGLPAISSGAFRIVVEALRRDLEARGQLPPNDLNPFGEFPS